MLGILDFSELFLILVVYWGCITIFESLSPFFKSSLSQIILAVRPVSLMQTLLQFSQGIRYTEPTKSIDKSMTKSGQGDLWFRIKKQFYKVD